jgi:hypothetical protein
VRRGFGRLSKTILAYYTPSRRELKLEQLPAEIAKKAGKYGYVGVTLLGKGGSR